MRYRLGMIGGGNMGYAIARGAIKTGVLKPTDLIVADAHSDVVLWLEAGRVDLAKQNTVGQTDLPRLKAGGVDVVAFNLWADPLYIPQGLAASRTRHMIEVWRTTIELP